MQVRVKLRKLDGELRCSVQGKEAEIAAHWVYKSQSDLGECIMNCQDYKWWQKDEVWSEIIELMMGKCRCILQSTGNEQQTRQEQQQARDQETKHYLSQRGTNWKKGAISRRR